MKIRKRSCYIKLKLINKKNKNKTKKKLKKNIEVVENSFSSQMLKQAALIFKNE